MSIPLALLAGAVSFASPCFLPIVPVYVGYVAGTEQTGGRGRPPAVLRQSLVFVAGFTVVFVGLWAAFGLIGYAVGDYRPVLHVLGGAVLIVMGLHVIGLLDLPVLQRSMRLSLGSGGGTASAPTYRRSALLGVAFAAGWTPCIGPVLGSVIGLASQTSSAGWGITLLLVYSLGLGLPFVGVALGGDWVSQRLGFLARHHRAISLLSGTLLLLIGFLMITDRFSRLSALVPAFGL